ncbi:hypothetical protein TRFO_16889 [Tritrichomonas foetus]|uniref:Protein kinase domain-containing protein n=1 Tax=Tritrichomonas foetus TaxID=1144522 RepID=A0A1J4KUF3_9EUKA|nr:hypothetical protein TRFO_16889 [Tritrichomonas foetus]|eukprot:OHT13125.1 hypothetical protein TRFO_16889 [Tritrichomonas foetus]
MTFFVTIFRKYIRLFDCINDRRYIFFLSMPSKLSEAFKAAINAANETIVYTKVTSTLSEMLNQYKKQFSNLKQSHHPAFTKSNRKELYASVINELKKLTLTLSKLNNSQWSLISLDYPILEPIDKIGKCMSSLYNIFIEQNIDLPKFSILDSLIAEDFISLYGIFAISSENTKAQAKLNEIKEIMNKNGISIPTQKKNNLLDDDFSSFSKYIISHSSVQKKRIIRSNHFGDFYKGEYKNNDVTRKVLIFEIPSFRINFENFQREMQLYSSLSHPNIVEFIGVTKTEPYWIITAKCGRPLRHYLQSKRRFRNISPLVKTQIAYTVAEAMAYLHSKNIIHRDLSAANIFLDHSKTPYITNFSLSRFLSEDESLLLTNNVGSEKCRAPELTNDSKYGQEVDVFSFGMFLYELLTGTIPFDEMSNIDAANAIMQANRPEIPSSTPSNLAQLIQKCWAPLAIDRPTFINVLETMINEEIYFPPASLEKSPSSFDVDSILINDMNQENIDLNKSQISGQNSNSSLAVSGSNFTFVRRKSSSFTPENLDSQDFRIDISDFYETKKVVTSDIQYCIDLIHRISNDINDAIAFKHQANRIKQVLQSYILALMNSKEAKDDLLALDPHIDLNGLISSFSRLNLCVKNITSPIWENNALVVPVTRPMEDLNEIMANIYSLVVKMDLPVEKYTPNEIDIALDFRFLYNTYQSNYSGLNTQLDKRMKEIEKFMNDHSITAVPTQKEIDKRISSVFKAYNNYCVHHKNYQKLETIGEGATSFVYIGIDKKTNTKVAIKEFTEEYMKTENCGFYLHREIAALSTLHHEYLAKFFGATKKSPVWVISEFIEQGDLESYIASNKLTPIQKTRIAFEIAEGMAYLHSMKMIHRDLKTNNILLDSKLEPKIVDFGFTRPIFLTMSMAVGTPIYMAPEVIKSSYYDYKADVFSYALILSEMISGIKPLTNYCFDPLAIQQYILDGLRPTFDIEVSDEFLDLLEKMWADSYKERPSFSEILDEMCAKKIAFPGASQEEIEVFYIEKVRKIQKTKIKRLNGNLNKRSLSFFMK